MALHLTSAAFKDGAEIPARNTCDAANVSPPLTWSGVPANTKSLVLIVDDPDAPDPRAPRTVWVHWVVYNLPVDSPGLPEGATRLPSPAHSGINDFGKTGYGGPCPPIGRHRYFFKLYALDASLGDLGKATKARVEAAMAGHVLAQAQLVGTYQRHR
jgi:Raf kinase inhibitor-like YbhB/YbcL family protein